MIQQVLYQDNSEREKIFDLKPSIELGIRFEGNGISGDGMTIRNAFFSRDQLKALFDSPDRYQGILSVTGSRPSDGDWD
jgi:hypothetical protein